jgi:hypothetical protein
MHAPVLTTMTSTQLVSTKLDVPECRSKVRFPIALDLRYRALAKREQVSGVGTTVNLSSRGVLILARGHKVATGAALEVSMDWPIPIGGISPQQLTVAGRVVRSDTYSFAVSFSTFDFQARQRSRERLPDLVRRSKPG